MAVKKTRGSDTGSAEQDTYGWDKLTWDDIRSWAGTNGLSKGRGDVSCVSQLQITSDGRLLAWVTGPASIPAQRWAFRTSFPPAPPVLMPPEP